MVSEIYHISTEKLAIQQCDAEIKFYYQNKRKLCVFLAFHADETLAEGIQSLKKHTC